MCSSDLFVLASVSMKPLGGGVGKIRMAAEADNANARTPAETADTDILILFAFMFSMASFDAPFYK